MLLSERSVSSDDSGVDSMDLQGFEKRLFAPGEVPPEYSRVYKKKSPEIRVNLSDLQSLNLGDNLDSFKSENLLSGSAEKDDDNLQELSELLESTNELLSRNDRLRGSLTVSVKRPSSESGFVRHVPSRQPLHEGKRRSIRLAPKTVLNLASKFDSMIDSAPSQSCKNTLPRELKSVKIDNILSALHKITGTDETKPRRVEEDEGVIVKACPAYADERQLDSIIYGFNGTTFIEEEYDEEGDYAGTEYESIHPRSVAGSVTDGEWIDIESEPGFQRKPNRSSIVLSRRKCSNPFCHRRRVLWNEAMIKGQINNGEREFEISDEDREDELYESIYETIPFSGESDFDEILDCAGFTSEDEEKMATLPKKPVKKIRHRIRKGKKTDKRDMDSDASGGNFAKFAEAAGKKMKKLRRHWSVRKNDLTRSLSKIKKAHFSSDHTVTRRRRSKKSNSSSSSATSLANMILSPKSRKGFDEATFYVTLTIEEKNGEDTPVASPRENERMSDGKSGGILATTKSRKFSTKSNIIRPTEAPPAPPNRSLSKNSCGQSSGLYSREDTASQSSELVDMIEETYTSSLFQSEPLYQFYNVEEAITEKFENTYECLNPLSEEPSEEIQSVMNKSDYQSLDKRVSRCSAMDLIHGTGMNCGGRRTMWAELPDVIRSGSLEVMDRQEVKLQEAIFEVITSEASYLKSLNILISHFISSTKLSGNFISSSFADEVEDSGGVLSRRESRILFSDILAVRQCSEKFLAELETRWQASILLKGVMKVIERHARANFGIYVKYCTNQVYQDRLLKKLRNENPKFVEVLKELESSPACQSLAMQSFLMLPMQRVTRYPLLLGAIFNRLPPSSEEYSDCKSALELINKLVYECNESARNMERMEEMLILSRQLDFRDLRAIPLISARRWLVKQGQAVRIWWKENSEAKLTFGRSKVNKQHLNLFLFTDLLVITKRKSDERYNVIDHCPRNLVQITKLDSFEGIIPSGVPGGSNGPKDLGYLSWFTLLQNNERKTIEWLLSFSSESDRDRWMSSVTPSDESQNSEEKVYEAWDCPRIEAREDYIAKKESEDEISLAAGQRADVLRKLTNSGWYYVQRLSDQKCGWIPIKYTVELESNHIRARNFKQRYAVLKLMSSTSSPSPLKKEES